MTIEKITYVERVLITLNQDRTMKGAHEECISVIKEGDTVLSSSMCGAKPLDGETLALVLPSQSELMAENTALMSDIEGLNTDIEGLNEDLDTANQTIESLNAEAERLNERIQELESQITTPIEQPAPDPA